MTFNVLTPKTREEILKYSIAAKKYWCSNGCGKTILYINQYITINGERIQRFYFCPNCNTLSRTKKDLLEEE